MVTPCFVRCQAQSFLSRLDKNLITSQLGVGWTVSPFSCNNDAYCPLRAMIIINSVWLIHDACWQISCWSSGILDTTFRILNRDTSLLKPWTACSYGILCGLMDSPLRRAPHMTFFAHGHHMSGWSWWVGNISSPIVCQAHCSVSPSSLDASRNRWACLFACLPFFSYSSALVVMVCTTVPVPRSYLKVVDIQGLSNDEEWTSGMKSILLLVWTGRHWYSSILLP